MYICTCLFVYDIVYVLLYIIIYAYHAITLLKSIYQSCLQRCLLCACFGIIAVFENNRESSKINKSRTLFRLSILYLYMLVCHLIVHCCNRSMNVTFGICCNWIGFFQLIVAILIKLIIFFWQRFASKVVVYVLT